MEGIVLIGHMLGAAVSLRGSTDAAAGAVCGGGAPRATARLD